MGLLAKKPVFGVTDKVRLKLSLNEPSHQDFHCLPFQFNFYSNNSNMKETGLLSEFR